MRGETMASLPDDVATARHVEWEGVAADVLSHVSACDLGCNMAMVRCPEGERLAEAERTAWDAYRAARTGERRR